MIPSKEMVAMILFFIDRDDSVVGGAGFDVVFFEGKDPLNFDVSVAAVEAAVGGVGNDTIKSSGAWDAILGGGDGDDLIIGANRKDILISGGGADKLFAGDDDDSIYAKAGDQIFGGRGVDKLDLSGGPANINLSLIGIEVVYGTAEGDRFYCDETGIVILAGRDGDDWLTGGLGPDSLAGGTESDLLIGGGGSDTYLYWRGDGADIVKEGEYGGYVASAVTRTLSATYSYSTYDPNTGQYYSAKVGTAQLQLSDANFTNGPHHTNGGANDVIRFGEGISAADLKLQLIGNDLFVGVKPAAGAGGAAGGNTVTPDGSDATLPASEMADVIRLANWADPLDRVETIQYADGSSQSVASLMQAQGLVVPVGPLAWATQNGDATNNNMLGGVGADKLVGNGGNDTLNGGTDGTNANKGTDRLEGGAGDDVYVLGRGSGWDVARDENATLVTLSTTAEAVYGTYTVPWTYTWYSRSSWTEHDPDKGLTGGDTTGGSGSTESFAAFAAPTLTAARSSLPLKGEGEEGPLLLGEGSRSGAKVGGVFSLTGEDTSGGSSAVAGEDPGVTYYTYEAHQATITLTFVDSGWNRNTTWQGWLYGDGGRDAIKLGAGVGIEDVALRSVGEDMVLALRDAATPEKTFWTLADRLWIENWSNAQSRIETLQFADGSSVDISQIVTAYAGDKGDEVIIGDSAWGWRGGHAHQQESLANWLSGGAGNDVLIAGAGNDFLIGGAGDDVLAGRPRASTRIFRQLVVGRGR